MNIPEIKLHIKLEWHLGIPDGRRSWSGIFDYTDNEYNIEDILDKIVVEQKLIEPRERIQCMHFGNEIHINDYDGDYIGTAYVKPVLCFKDKVFKLEEIE